MSVTGDMSPEGTPLDSIADVPNTVSERLRESWITTAEQLVAASATPGGIHSLAEQASVDEDEMTRAVESARASLDPDVVASLETPVEDDYGLGALPPERLPPERME